MNRLSAQNLHLSYPLFTRAGRDRAIAALKDVSFDLEQGDRLGVVGANGAGKSTLLRVLSGIAEPDQGQVIRHGRVQSLLEMGLGVNQDASGKQNIRLRLLAEGCTWAEAEERAKAIEDYSELGEYLEYPVDTYSRGMQLRLSFSIATSLNADILIMDEWIGAGDQAFREKASRRMHQMVDDAGIVVLASHQNPLLRRVCNKGLWLENGEVRMFDEIGRVLDFYRASLESDEGVPLAPNH